MSSNTSPSSASDLEALLGMRLAGRYVLQRQVGSGSTTAIFEAADEKTGRIVTFKLIRPRLAAVPEFQAEFDIAMRGAAELRHPNIAAIYDWGYTDVADTRSAYVVTERLTGGSLRDMFDRGRRLSPSQALAVGLDACKALDHAHRRGNVHSELTPAKIVFGDDRRLRIIDFGLGRLIGGLMWLDPSNVPNHVAWYAAPEQATGGTISGRTDVYALSLILTEAMTGDVPFKDNSTTATLNNRVGKLLPVSADMGPLASVLEHAARPEAEDRLSAAGFGKNLVHTATRLPRPEPLPLLSSGLFETPEDRIRKPSDPTGGITRPRGHGARPAANGVAEVDTRTPATQAPAVADSGVGEEVARSDAGGADERRPDTGDSVAPVTGIPDSRLEPIEDDAPQYPADDRYDDEYEDDVDGADRYSASVGADEDETGFVEQIVVDRRGDDDNGSFEFADELEQDELEGDALGDFEPDDDRADNLRGRYDLDAEDLDTDLDTGDLDADDGEPDDLADNRRGRYDLDADDLDESDVIDAVVVDAVVLESDGPGDREIDFEFDGVDVDDSIDFDRTDDDTFDGRAAFADDDADRRDRLYASSREESSGDPDAAIDAEGADGAMVIDLRGIDMSPAEPSDEIETGVVPAVGAGRDAMTTGAVPVVGADDDVTGVVPVVGAGSDDDVTGVVPVIGADRDVTGVVGVVGADSEITGAVPVVEMTGVVYQRDDYSPDSWTGDLSTGGPPPVVDGVDTYDGLEPDRSRRRRFPVKTMLGILIVIGLVAVAAVAFRLLSTTRYLVPDLVGTPVEEAQQLIAPNKWNVSVTRQRSDQQPKAGLIISTSPPAGQEVAEGEPFEMVVSDGPVQRELPDLEGVEANEAQARLQKLGMVVTVEKVNDEKVPAGTVIRWYVPDQDLQPGALVDPGTDIILVVSSGPVQRKVPNLIGMPLKQARASLADLQLKLSVDAEQFNANVPKGAVSAQSEQPDSMVDRDSEIRVVVSKGTTDIKFPDVSDVVGYEALKTKLEEAGFTVVWQLGDQNATDLDYFIDGEVPKTGDVYPVGTEVRVEPSSGG